MKLQTPRCSQKKDIYNILEFEFHFGRLFERPMSHGFSITTRLNCTPSVEPVLSGPDAQTPFWSVFFIQALGDRV